MPTLLSDHNCEGQSQKILQRLHKLGYTTWLDIDIISFDLVGLSYNASDEQVWLFCQNHGYYLLTGNRSTKDGAESLHAILGKLITETSLPVLTIGDLKRAMIDKDYCEACAEPIAQIIINAELYRGVPRLYIP